MEYLAAAIIILSLVTAFCAGAICERSRFIVGEWDKAREEDEEDDA